MDFSDAKTAPTVSLSRGCRAGGFQDGLATHAGLRHSRTPVAERVSGGGEPDPERSDQASLAAFGKPKVTLAEIVHRLGRKALEDVAATANPDTIRGWYRKLVANKFDGSTFHRRVGRPRIDEETERWVVQMAKDNPNWATLAL